MKFIIPGKLPTLNEMINASKRNKYAYESLKNDAIAIVVYSCKTKIPILPACDFIITWIPPDKRTDKDNIIAGQKYIFDGLQKAGKLTNDGWKQIGDITHKFAVDKQNPRIEVEMRERSA